MCITSFYITIDVNIYRDLHELALLIGVPVHGSWLLEFVPSENKGMWKIIWILHYDELHFAPWVLYYNELKWTFFIIAVVRG